MVKQRHLNRLVLAFTATAVFAISVVPGGARSALGLGEFLQTAAFHGLAVDPENPARLIAATHSGLYALDPVSMQSAPIGEIDHDLMGFSADPVQSGRFFASGHDAAMTGNLGVIGSQDGGLSWTALSPGVGGPVDFHQMELSRADPEILYGVYGGRMVQRSDDGGKSWRNVGQAPEGLIDIATSPSDPEKLFAATQTGLLQSVDAGASWLAAHDTAAPVSFVDVGTDGSVFAFMLGQGLIRADEATLDWQPVNADFGDGYILHFARDAKDPARMFGLTGTNALLSSSDAGANWTLIAKP